MQREEIQSGRKENGRFEGEGGAGALHWQRGTRYTRLNSGARYNLEELKEEDTVLVDVEPSEEAETQQRGQLQK